MTSIPAVLNPNAGKSSLQQVTDFLASASGSFRSLQIAEKVCRLASLAFQQMGSSSSTYYDSLAGRLQGAWIMLTLPRLPDVTKRALDAVVGLLDRSTLTNAGRTTADQVHDIFEAGAAWSYAGAIFGASTLNAGSVCTLGADTLDLASAAEDISSAGRHLAAASLDLEAQTNLVHTQRYAMIKLAKSIASVVSGTLGLMVLAFGGPVVPALALLALGLISSISAVTAHFYKETAPYKMVDFTKFVLA